MTPKERLEMIEDKIKLLNSSVLKNKNWKIDYVNRGTNNYCLVIKLKSKELHSAKFDTYGSVLNCLLFLEFMFSKKLDEIDKEVKK